MTLAAPTPIFPEATMRRGATLSPCGLYRYDLWRTWDTNKPSMGVILLNPSTADASKDDPTVTRLIKRATFSGFGSLCLVNLFAYRATNPEELARVPDPVGPHNDTTIMHQMQRTQVCVLGWGKHGTMYNRHVKVLKLLHKHLIMPRAWAVNLDETPAHPLYLPYELAPESYANVAAGILRRA